MEADAEDTEEVEEKALCANANANATKKKRRHKKLKSIDSSALLSPSSPEYVVVSPQTKTNKLE